jgi:branched-chain amino acid transport system permease protein
MSRLTPTPFLSRWPKLMLVISLVLALGLFYGSEHVNRYYVGLLISIGINVTLAVSLNLINGYTGQFSLGHAGFMAVGAYAAATMTMYAGPHVIGTSPSPLLTQLWFFVALYTGGLAAAVAGAVVGIPSLRLKGDYLAIVTLGFGEIIGVIVRNVPALGGALGLNGLPNYTNIFWVFGVAIICTYIVLTLVHSTYGRGFIAVHDDEVAAEAMGINSTRYKIVAFVIGAFWAGIAGGLYGHYALTIEPKGFDFMRSIEIVVMVILGGMGNTPGVIAAAILLTVLPEFLRKFADYRMILYSFLLIVFMLTRPQGLFTFRRKTKPVLSA